LSEKASGPGGEGLLAVGKILRPHGIRGALVVEALTDWPERFAPGARMLLEMEPSDHREVTVVTGGPHKGRLLVALEGVCSIEDAEKLRGKYLMIEACDAAALGEGEYWAHELVGMKLQDEAGKTLGEVADVLCREAQDMLVAEAPDGSEFSVPMVAEFIKDVDVEKRVITVSLLEGMAP
jgi:16S rRNA processing protein RimM